MGTVIGWDIGGANLKLAGIENGRVREVVQRPCPILPEARKFDLVIAEAQGQLAIADAHAVTMTGELSDVFASRTEGVGYLINLVERVTGGAPVHIYGGRAGFLAPEEAVRRPLDVASANWHAAGRLAAEVKGDGLVIDIGTTTTDLVPFSGGRVQARGYTDAERLTGGELIYTGVVRTPVIAVAQSAPFRGRRQGLAAERFATMADVYRLTAALAEDADPYPAADNRDKTIAGSAARLARMLGRDAEDAALEEWVALARYFADRQLARLEVTARALLEREGLAPDAPVIGAGCGRFVAEALAERLGQPYVDFVELIAVAPAAREGAARCAPAVAVALLHGKALK